MHEIWYKKRKIFLQQLLKEINLKLLLKKNNETNKGCKAFYKNTL